MAIKTLLIDDEPLATRELQTMLKDFSDIELIGTAENVTDAIQKIQTLQPQLIFLDINMPGKSGFDLLEELDDAPLVIFVTAYDEYAIKAFEVNALDYLLKPVNAQRLGAAIDKIRKQVNRPVQTEKAVSMDKRIFIKDGERCYFVPLSEVFLIESVGNYARFYYQHHKPLLHKSLNYLENRLPDTHFFRAGRQQIININFIKNISPHFNHTLQVELENGLKVDISQRQSVRFKELMGL
jgi:two-component system LytT family response regulator